jgi:endonuclease G
MIDADRAKLHATGYVLGQGELVRDITEFVFGQFGTYQVPISSIEQVTGLSFDGLAAVDPMAEEARHERVPPRGIAFRLIERPEDVLLTAGK